MPLRDAGSHAATIVTEAHVHFFEEVVAGARPEDTPDTKVCWRARANRGASNRGLTFPLDFTQLRFWINPTTLYLKSEISFDKGTHPPHVPGNTGWFEIEGGYWDAGKRWDVKTF